MWVSQTAAADEVGVSKQRINELVRDGRLRKNDKKQVHLAQVLQHFRRERAPEWTESPLAAGAPAAPGPADGDDDEPAGSPGFLQVRKQREQIRAARESFEFDVTKGLYLPKRDVEEAMVTSGRLIRQQLDAIAGWADELYALAAQGGSAADLRRLLKEKTRALEQAVADRLSLRPGEEAADA